MRRTPGGGINADNSLASDGRRAPSRVCHTPGCGNAISNLRDRTCGPCRIASFERAKERSSVRAKKRRDVLRGARGPMPTTAVEELSLGLNGLGENWFCHTDGMGVA